METPPRTETRRATASALVSCCLVACLGARLLSSLLGKQFPPLWEAAPGTWAIVGVALFALLALCAALVRLERQRLSLAVFLGLAVLPWVVSIGFVLQGMHEMGDVLGKVAIRDVPQVLRIVSVGLSEQLGAQVLGAWLSASLLAGAAVAWAARGWHTRQPGLLPAGALLLTWGLYGFARSLSSFQLLTTLREADMPELEVPVPLLTGDLAALVPLRGACLATLGLALLTSLVYAAGWGSRVARPERPAGLVALAVLVALTLWDGLPVRESVHLAHAFNQSPPSP